MQQTIDHGLSGPTADLHLVRVACGLAALAVGVTAVANYLMNVRLYRTTEDGLLALRTRAFRRVHDLSVLHQATAAARLAGVPGDRRRGQRSAPSCSSAVC